MRSSGSVSLPVADLFEQLEQGQQARLGADEGALGQAAEPGDGLFRGRRQIEIGFVRSLAVELAQPALVVAGPVVEIVQRGAGKGPRDPAVR